MAEFNVRLAQMRVKRDTIVHMNAANLYNREMTTGSMERDESYYELLVNKVNINNWEHRWDRAQFDPNISALAERRPEEVWESELEFWHKRTKKIMEDDFTFKTLDYFEDYNINYIFQQADGFVTTHGWAFICRFKYKTQFNKLGEIYDWFYRVYSAETLTQWAYNHSGQIGDIQKDRYGFPTAIWVPKNPDDVVGNQIPLEITADNFVFVSLNIKGNRVFGETEFKNVWIDCIHYTEAERSQSNFLSNFALIPTIYMPESTGDTEARAAESKIKKARWGLKALSIRGDPETTKFAVEGGAKVMPDYPGNLESIRRTISGATGYPYRWFAGDPGGALSAASEDGLQVIQKHESHFKKFVPAVQEFIRKFIDANAPVDYTIRCNVKLKQTEKDKWETENLKSDAILKREFLTLEMVCEELGYDAEEFSEEDKKKKLWEIFNQPMGLNVQGLENTPQQKQPQKAEPPKQSDVKRPNQDSLVPYVPFIEKYESRSKDSLKKEYHYGSETIAKVDTMIYDIHRNAHNCWHYTNVKLDSMTENEEYWIFDCHIFDSEAKLPYTDPITGITTIERNPPEEIKKLVDAFKGKKVPLGLEHEDGLEIKERQIGYTIPLKFNGRQDDSKAYFHKKTIIDQFPEIKTLIDENAKLELSAAYKSKDLDSVLSDYDIDHSNLELFSVVVTKAGRCNAGGGQCEITPG